ncbi:MAG TPA: hypothetical protein VN620_10745, partial [Candidatus Methylomirabilis sp.]|nr:hypothetical protein [Candidatus Methylomirabilis sp.]
MSSASGSAIKRINGWREGPPVTVSCQSFDLLAGPSPSRQNQLRTKKEYCAVHADSERPPQEADNGPMPDTAGPHEGATGVDVSKTLPCSDGHIVLLDYYQASQSKVWANLRRL